MASQWQSANIIDGLWQCALRCLATGLLSAVLMMLLVRVLALG